RVRAAARGGEDGSSGVVAALDWFPNDVATPLPEPHARPRPKAAPRPRRRAQGRRLRGGIVWITTFAVLLAGVVALNVAVLRVNMNLDRLNKQQIQLQAENTALALGEQATTVYADPSAVTKPRQEARVAARVLGLHVKEVFHALTRQGTHFSYVYRKAPTDRASALAKRKLTGLHFYAEERRTY